MPHGKSQPMPLIVMPHGGPISVFDHRYFHSETQFFAANGYAVLRVNYRGSSGYSFLHKEAGKMQWGNMILEDIYRATQAVANRKDIAADKVCLVGMSYGGYAATMLTIKYPELYKCAVNIAGVSDVALYLNAHNMTKKQDVWAKEYIGDPVADYESLKSISPVYKIQGLKNPIFIIHGAKDSVVDIEHASRLKLMLDKHNKSYQYHIIEDGGHHLGDAKASIDLFVRVLTFLKTYI
nr:alpha/beta fold hydrolase [Pleionea sp. CnH1-48]